MQRKEIARALRNRTMVRFMVDKDMVAALPVDPSVSDMTKVDFLEAALALARYDVEGASDFAEDEADSAARRIGARERTKQFITLADCYVQWLEEHPEFWREGDFDEGSPP